MSRRFDILQRRQFDRKLAGSMDQRWKALRTGKFLSAVKGRLNKRNFIFH
jgi:hypothetical protein